MRPEHGQLGVAGERRLAGQALVEDAAERVHVGPAVDLAALDLLGRGIGGRAEREPASRRWSRVGEAPRQAEVGQIDVLVLVEEHVRRLDVPVHEPARVRGVERGRDLGADRDGALRLEAPLALQQRLELAPLDVAHGDVQLAVDLAGVVDRDDVGMLQRGRQLGLGQEAFAEVARPRTAPGRSA